MRNRIITKKNETTAPLVAERIAQRILVIRRQKVMLDADLATLYDVPTKRLNQQVKRNAERFPEDFMFQLARAERDEVVANCDHLRQLKFSPTMPFAFTEHGALMAASVLNTPRAVEVSLYVVRAFVRLRETVVEHKGLATKLEELEQKTEALALRHDTLAASTHTQLRQVFEAIRQLMGPPERKPRPIGFITPEEKKRG
ncbi:MAG: ORF6N domain-containing protein [Betaproteobacteria bacterium]|nr:MAG: ORF6N domain-containing protein [Betaproteobacteria bacterium]